MTLMMENKTRRKNGQVERMKRRSDTLFCSDPSGSEAILTMPMGVEHHKTRTDKVKWNVPL